MFDFSLLAPRPRVRSIRWYIDNIQTAEGRPYDHAVFPHIGAPGGPCDALDDRRVREIWLQWATRLGKTFYGQCASLFLAATNPCPMMFASPKEDLTLQVMDRNYKMIAKCGPLKNQLAPKNRRRQDLIELANCRTYAAWARSTSTLADKSIKFGHALEVDKWEHESTSKEGDPLQLFDERFKDNNETRKQIKESSPSVKGRSRVEAGRLQSTNCQYYVPCPHCERYQVLKMERVKWDRDENGRHNKVTARATGHYVCEHCEGKIFDEHRSAMMRAGVWVPEGCGIDDQKAKAAAQNWTKAKGSDGAALDQVWRGWEHADWIVGKPLRDGTDAGYQLSSLYALTIGWGDVAAKWVSVQNNPQNLRNFINGWLAETWEIVERKESWETVGQRLIDPEIRFGVVPLWASLLTMAVDRQRIDNKHPWVLDAWGPGRRSATIAYGIAFSLEEIEELAKKYWPHADQGPPLRTSIILIDSGFQPLGVHGSCKRLKEAGIVAIPCKGSPRPLDSEYNVTVLGQGSAAPGSHLCHVDTVRSQLWIERAIYDIDPKGEGGFSIYNAPLGEHEFFLSQLLNDAPIQKLDSKNNTHDSWERINESFPNDYRDCKRYSYTSMLLTTRQGPISPRGAVVVRAAKEATESRFRELKFRR